LQDLFNGQKKSLLDDYEYVMHGKVYKLDKKVEEGATQAVVYVSYGGLLMQLTADHNKLSQFEIDGMVYLLVRKAN
jgi:DNA-directed RNA polymerase I, II, and III subunit RPABC3